MQRRDPLISVVMPVFNAGAHLVDAVASILTQSLQDWELICIDDGSQDGSGETLDWFARQDARVRVVHQVNAGIVDALNRGCHAANAPLICRMDGDDVALPGRLAMQADFLRTHPTCTVVGGAILEIDAEGDPLGISRLPVEHESIVDNLLHRRSGHFHPTTMFRADAFEAVGGYRKAFQWVEDHDLWLRMAQRGQLANLREVLLCYRQHASSVCWQRSAQQRTLMNAVLRDAYRARGRQLPDELVADETRTRSPAGPGKWARAAAKGGYPPSVRKHLRQLITSDADRTYKARMTVECLLRLMAGYPRRLLAERNARVPTFQSWRQRAERELALPDKRAA